MHQRQFRGQSKSKYVFWVKIGYVHSHIEQYMLQEQTFFRPRSLIYKYGRLRSISTKSLSSRATEIPDFFAYSALLCPES
jgi:hypothetical protein